MIKERVNEIDLLRFLAAIAVVFFHYCVRSQPLGLEVGSSYIELAPVACYGYLGVQLFFMISGFVIFMSVEGRSLDRFIASRVSRLYPAYWVCCTITFLVILLMGGGGDGRFTVSVGQYLINMTMLNGFVRVDYIDGVYWTLLEELKFYGLVGIVLALRKMHRSEQLLYAWLMAIVVIAIVDAPRIVKFILLDAYAAYFIAGSLFYLLWRDGKSLKKLAGLLVCWSCSIYQVFDTVPHNIEFIAMGVDEGIVTVIITLFFLVMFMVSTRSLGYFGRLNWVRLGVLTYPLYLLHQNIGYLLFREFHGYNEHLIFWGIIGLLLLVAYLVNVWVERKTVKALFQMTQKICNCIVKLRRRNELVQK